MQAFVEKHPLYAYKNRTRGRLIRLVKYREESQPNPHHPIYNTSSGGQKSKRP